MQEAQLVAILVEPRSWHNRLVIEGVAAFCREQTAWRLVLGDEIGGSRVDRFVRSRPAGVIADITSPSVAKAIHRLGVPAIDIAGLYPVPSISRVVCDDSQIMRRAVDHLLDRRLRHIAFVGERGHRLAEQRRRWCEEHVLQSDGRRGSVDATPVFCAAAMLSGVSLLPDRLAGLAAWLRGLPRPVGIVACDDVWGGQVLRACGDHGLRVPDEVAVVGVGDDPVYCQMSDPLLSSVDPAAVSLGWKAAAVLHAVLSRGVNPPAMTLIAPGVVQSRASTDVLAIGDENVVAAVRFLRENACSGITPGSVASRLGLSRRTLERMFQRHVGRSPAAEIARVRLETVRELLATTSLTLAAIASRVGFANVETLHRCFRRQCGETPGAFRSLRGKVPRGDHKVERRRRR